MSASRWPNAIELQWLHQEQSTDQECVAETRSMQVRLSKSHLICLFLERAEQKLKVEMKLYKVGFHARTEVVVEERLGRSLFRLCSSGQRR